MTQKERIDHAGLQVLAEQTREQLIRWLSELSPVSQTVIAELSLDEETMFSPDAADNQHLFGPVHRDFPEETKAVLDRSRHSAELLAFYADGTNLRTPENGLSITDALAILRWLVDIQPSIGEYVYQENLDLLRFNLDQQMDGVRHRLLPHSLAAGLVSYHLANELNRAVGAVLIDPYHVLIQNLMHESQRMVTHHIVLHDALLPKVMQYGLGHTDFVQDHGAQHPRLLDVDSSDLTLDQLMQFLLWMGDAFTKASPSEAQPFNTEDGDPHFRVAQEGRKDVLNSLRNYGDVSGEAMAEAVAGGEYLPVLLQAFAHDFGRVIQYTIDMELLAAVPQMLEERGVSLQNALDAVEPVWAAVLKKFFNNTTITKEEMYAELEQGLEGFLAAHPLYVPNVATH